MTKGLKSALSEGVATSAALRLLGAELRGEMKSMETRLTARIGVIAAAGAVLGIFASRLIG